MDVDRCDRLRRAGISTALVLATSAAFAEVRGHEFLFYDDQSYVWENPMVTGGLTLEGFCVALTSFYKGNWFPLTWLSHMLDVELFGLWAGGHHLTSLVLHAANAVVLFLVLAALTRAPWRSAFAAALFALHPLHVESVAWVSARKDLLSTLLFLLSVGAWTRWARIGTRAGWTASLLLFALALAAKPMVVTLPFVLLLLDLWPLGRLRSLRPDQLWPLVREKLPHFCLALAGCLLALHAQGSAGYIAGHRPLPVRAANAVLAYTSYLRKTLWPADLAIPYPYPTVLSVWQIIAAVLMLLALTSVAIALWRRRPWVTVGWLWFGGMLVPTIGLVQVGAQSMADRFSYVPLIGLFVIAAWGGAELLSRLPRGRAVAASAAAAVLLACALTTRAQVSYWSDSIALFEHSVSVTSGNYVAHLEAGVGRAGRGEFERAIAHYEQALRIKPRHADALANLGWALLATGDVQAAITQLEQSLVIAPEGRDVRFALALALEQAGRFAEDVPHLEQQLRLAPEHRGALQRLARIRAAHPDPALRDGEAALRLVERICREPCRGVVELDLLAMASMEAGRQERAVEAAKRAAAAARGAGHAARAAAIDRRLEGYREGRPYRISLPEP